MGIGLEHPRDLEAWHAWQRSTRPWLSRARAHLAGIRRSDPGLTITTVGNQPRLVVALEAVKATSITALLDPLTHLGLTDIGVAVISNVDVRDHLPPGPWQARPWQPDDAGELNRSAKVVLSTGHYLAVGAMAYRALPDALFVTVQHGLLTPQAPPLAPESHLLAWSGKDADFWASGRNDVETRVVGSPLLAAATRVPEMSAAQLGPPVYLGQLHAAELERSDLARSAGHFCKMEGAVYRPHPSETDRASRAQHAAWEAQGVQIDRSGTPLVSLKAPVVSAFSTGVLEAAARGVPAWVHFENPPIWLEEFWERYGLRQWGDDPTPAPAVPDLNPAHAIAQEVRAMMES